MVAAVTKRRPDRRKARWRIEQLVAENHRLRGELHRVVQHFDMRAELYTNDADAAAGMADIARQAVAA